MTQNIHTFCVAPMMDWTDKHDRYFLRLISQHTRLYTEMITADAIIHGNRNKLLDFNPQEHPIALQLGGSDPKKLATATHIATQWGYDEFNLNVGCPSSRVQSGTFGACLMQHPETVADCIAAMKTQTDKPVTIKCRIGVDDQNPEIALPKLIDLCAQAGAEIFIIHARKAWLKGLSPKQNRDIPPLDYDLVYRIKAKHPERTIIINGGIESLDECDAHLDHTDGVMLGRAAYKNPYILATVDARYFAAKSQAPTRHQIADALIPYAEKLIAQNQPLHTLTRHILGLYHATPRARFWRQTLSQKGISLETYKTLCAQMRDHQTRNAA